MNIPGCKISDGPSKRRSRTHNDTDADNEINE